jgi:hypothetical protein
MQVGAQCIDLPGAYSAVKTALRTAHVLFTLFVLCFCFVFRHLVYPVLPVSLDCPYLIAPSVFSNYYLSVTLYTIELQRACTKLPFYNSIELLME